MIDSHRTHVRLIHSIIRFPEGVASRSRRKLNSPEAGEAFFFPFRVQGLERHALSLAEEATSAGVQEEKERPAFAIAATGLRGATKLRQRIGR